MPGHPYLPTAGQRAATVKMPPVSGTPLDPEHRNTTNQLPAGRPTALIRYPLSAAPRKFTEGQHFKAKKESQLFKNFILSRKR